MFKSAGSVCLLFAFAVAGCASTGYRERHRITELEAFYDQRKNTHYQYGGTSSQGIDCSALVSAAYTDIFKLSLPRTTELQAKLGMRVRKKRLQPGDLVFFKTGLSRRHVGIYVDDGVFIHSSASKGVQKSLLTNPYWREHYWKSKRIVY